MFDKPTRNDMPSRLEIAQYWFPKHFARFGRSRTGDDELLHNECWACGDNCFRIERCHIHSLWDGGSNTADNLVLLCRPCHEESEQLPPDTFWTWIRNKRQIDFLSEAERTERKLAKIGFDRKTFAAMIEEDGPKEAVEAVFKAMGFTQKYEDMLVLYKKEMAS